MLTDTDILSLELTACHNDPAPSNRISSPGSSGVSSSRNALSGDVKAAKDLLDRLDGRSRQSVPEQGDTTVRDAALARLRAIHEQTESDTSTLS